MMRAVPVGMIAPGQPLAPFARPEEEPEQVRLPFFVVQEEKDGTLSAIGIGYYDLAPGESFDQVFLQELIQEVTRSGRPFGELEQYHLRFLRVDSPFGQRIVFADITSEQSTLNNLVKNCILIGVLCFFAFLGISIRLAAWTVKPVERAWQKQRQFVSDAPMTEDPAHCHYDQCGTAARQGGRPGKSGAVFLKYSHHVPADAGPGGTNAGAGPGGQRSGKDRPPSGGSEHLGGRRSAAL